MISNLRCAKALEIEHYVWLIIHSSSLIDREIFNLEAEIGNRTLIKRIRKLLILEWS